MEEEAELEVLLSLDGQSFEAAGGYVVEFSVKRTRRTSQRPHGIRYALVFRPASGEPFVRFDNAHGIERPGGRFVKPRRLSITGIAKKAIPAGPIPSRRLRGCSKIFGAR
jgi:hypothetical protein